MLKSFIGVVSFGGILFAQQTQPGTCPRRDFKADSAADVRSDSSPIRRTFRR